MRSQKFQIQAPNLISVSSLRSLIARIWGFVFSFSTILSLVALAALLMTIIDQSFGFVAEMPRVSPAALSTKPIEQLGRFELIEILQKNLSKNRLQAIEKEKTLLEHTREDLYALVMDKVIDPKVVSTWNLHESLFNQSSIRAEVEQKYPGATLSFKAWLNPQFLTRSMSGRAELAGVRTALMGSINLILITILFAFPTGVGAAIYLEEYARRDRWYNRVIQTNVENLAGVPSIVYGILGLAIFVRAFEPVTSGRIFGMPADNGRTILSAGLTMGLLVLPILIINAQEAIRAVPGSLRQASYGLGATKWQTIWYHVLPSALPGILTGTILAISRAIGETAPLILVGASTFITSDPSGPFSHFTALPIQIYNWSTRPQDAFRNIAGAAIIVLLTTLVTLNASAILLRNRFSKRL